MKPCPLCQNSLYKTVFIENDIEIVRCNNCRLVFSGYEGPSEELYWQNLETLNSDEIESQKFYWETARKPVYKQFLTKYSNCKGKILDVGCGLGFFVKMACDSGWNSYGYEISASAVNYAKKELKLKNIYAGRMEESDFRENYFDVITLWDVLEHISDPAKLLAYLFTILKPGGFLFIQTPNIDFHLPYARLKKIFFKNNPKIHFLEAKDHLNQFSSKTLKKFLLQSGFKRVELKLLKPIYTVQGSRNKVLIFFKLFYYHLTKLLWYISFRKVVLSNTLHTLAYK